MKRLLEKRNYRMPFMTVAWNRLKRDVGRFIHVLHDRMRRVAMELSKVPHL